MKVIEVDDDDVEESAMDALSAPRVSAPPPKKRLREELASEVEAPRLLPVANASWRRPRKALDSTPSEVVYSAPLAGAEQGAAQKLRHGASVRVW